MPTLQELLDRQRERTNAKPGNIISEITDMALQAKRALQLAKALRPTPSAAPGGANLPPPGVSPPGRMPLISPPIAPPPLPPLQQQALNLGQLGIGLTGQMQQAAQAVRPYQLAQQELGRPLTQTESEYMRVARQRQADIAGFQLREQLVPPPGPMRVAGAFGTAAMAAAQALDVPRQIIKEKVIEPTMGLVPGPIDVLKKAGLPDEIAMPLGALIAGPAAPAELTPDTLKAEVASIVLDPALVAFFPAQTVQAVRAAIRASPGLAAAVGVAAKSQTVRRAAAALREAAVGRAGEVGALERPGLRIVEEALSPSERAIGRHTLSASTPDGELAGRLEWRIGPAGVDIRDVVAVKEGRGVGTSLLRRALSDIRALHPDAQITASLNSASGARLFRRMEGTRFFTREGERITADEAIKLAAARKGPTVELGAAGEVPRVAPSELAEATLRPGERPRVRPTGPTVEETFWGAERQHLRSRKELVDDLTTYFTAARKYGREFLTLGHKEMQRKAAQLGRQREAAQGIRGLRGAARKLAGGQPTPDYAPPYRFFTPAEANELGNMIIEADLRSVTYGATSVAFLKAFFGGQKLTMSEIIRLEKVFGPKLAKSLTEERGAPAKALWLALDALNFPRAILAAFDFSYPLRQAVVPTIAHPIEATRAFKSMIRSIDEKTARQIAKDLENHPSASIWDASKLDYKVPWEGGIRSEREDVWAWGWADKIPGIRLSQRVFVTYGNKLRAEIFETVRLNWDSVGRTLESDPKEYRNLARWLNISTGRGEVAWIKEFLPALNAAFFSPRLVISRVQMPLELFTTSPAARQLVARDLAIFTTTGLTALALLKKSGLATVEIDPRSSDFGKAKIGKTRLDFWGGFQPIARYTAQLITGHAKYAARPGVPKIVDIDWKTTIGRFLWSKMAPGPGLAVDIFKGRTFIGQDIDLQPKNLQDQMFNRLVPLFFQDLVDATREAGLKGFVLGMPGVLGVGIQTYEKANEKQIAFLDSLDAVLTDTEKDALERGIIPNIIREMPEWQEITRELEEGRRNRPGSREYQTDLDQRNVVVGQASEQWETGEITGVEARKTVADARNEFRIKNDVRDFPGGGFLDDYYKATYDRATDPETGQLDYKELDDYIAEWDETATAEDKAAIAEHELAADSEMERLLRKDRVYIRESGYHDLPESLWAYFEETGIPLKKGGELIKPSGDYDDFDDYVSSFVQKRVKELIADGEPQDKAVTIAWGKARNLPIVKVMQKMLTDKRALARDRDGRLRQALLRWYKPISQEEMAQYGFPVGR